MTKKYNFIICFLLFFYFNTMLFAQIGADSPYSFECKNQTYSEAIKALSDQTKIPIAFTESFFDTQKHISKRFDNQPIAKILESILDQTEIGFKPTSTGFALYQLPPRYWTISGTLTDADSGQPLSWAIVSLLGLKMGTVANDFGYFSIKIKEVNTVELQARYLGYAVKTMTISGKSNQKIDIPLKQSSDLPEVVVSSMQGHLQPFTTPSTANIPAAWMQSVTSTVGEPDVQRQIAMLPGVVTGADGIGGLHIRGGNADQNLILFDGMPLYNASHAGGFFSIVNPLLVKSARLMKGTSPARYAGRLSSVLDIQSMEGNEKKWGATLSLTPISANMLIEGPLGKQGGAILLAFRQSLLSPWYAKLGKNYQKKANTVGNIYSQKSKYNFYDFNLRWHKKINTKHQIYLSAYQGSDKLDEKNDQNTPAFDFRYTKFVDRYKFDWGNKTLNFRWNYIPNDHWFGKTSITSSKFLNKISYFSQLTVYFDTIVPLLPFEDDYLLDLTLATGIKSNSIRSDWEWIPGNNFFGKIGAGLIKHNFNLFNLKVKERSISLDDYDEENQIPTYGSDSLVIEDQEIQNAFEGFAYTELEWQKKSWVINAGLHLAAFNRNKLFVVPQPRLNIAYQLSEKTAFEASYNRQAQFIQLLTVNDLGFPNDFWTPITKNQGPQTSSLLSLGITQNFRDSFVLHMEAYHKKLNRLAEFDFKNIVDAYLNSGDSDTLSINWEQNAVISSGKSQGLEFLLEKQTGRLTVLASYTLSKSTRSHFTNRPQFRFDVRHQFVLGALFQINKKWHISSRWQYFSGLPVNVLSQEDSGPFELIFLKYFKNDPLPPGSKTIPAFHRLDLSIGYKTNSKHITHDFSIGLNNVYNRKNVIFAVERYDPTFTQLVIYTHRALPILPSIRWVIQVK
jgi:hypothetical protein